MKEINAFLARFRIEGRVHHGRRFNEEAAPDFDWNRGRLYSMSASSYQHGNATERAQATIGGRLRPPMGGLTHLAGALGSRLLSATSVAIL